MKLFRIVLASAALLLAGGAAGAKDISTPAEWNAFVLAVNGGDWSEWKDADGVVNIVADLTFPKQAGIIESSLSWRGVLDGHGHTFTQKASRLPIVINVAPEGVIRNIVFAGVRPSHKLNGWASVIAVNNAGLIENCHSKVDFVVTADNANVHGLVRTNTGTVRACTNSGRIISSAPVQDLWVAGVVTDNQGVMENCANYGPISISGVDAHACVAGVCVFAKGRITNCVNEGAINVGLEISDNRVFYCGGVLARGECRGADAVFTNLRNKGEIKVVRNTDGRWLLLKCGVAGVLATVIDGDADHHVVLENAFNDAPVTLWEDESTSPLAGCFAVGGIVGRVGPNGGKETYLDISKDGFAFEMRNCRNAGTIDHSSASVFPIYFERSPSGARFAYAGGVAGVVYGSRECPALIENCINTGAVLCGSRKAADMDGGIAGGIGYAKMTNCMASTTFRPSPSTLLRSECFGAIGGAVGLILKDSELQNCQAKMTLDTGSGKVYSKGFIGAVAIGAVAHAENCMVSGGAAWGTYLPGEFKGKIIVK